VPVGAWLSLARAPGSGPGGRWFKSIRPDHFSQSLTREFWFFYSAVDDFVAEKSNEFNKLTYALRTRGNHLICKQGVGSSNLLTSTNLSSDLCMLLFFRQQRCRQFFR
jgi:hypothetical protein